MLKANILYYTFFFLLFLGFLSSLLFITIQIPELIKPKCYNPTLFNKDELPENITFSEHEDKRINDSHFSICLKNRIPVLRKCCSQGLLLNLTVSPIACAEDDEDKISFETMLPVYDENNGFISKYNLSNFHRLYGMITCPNGKYFNPLGRDEYSEITFQRDGTLLIKNVEDNVILAILDSDIFCLDKIKTEEGTVLGAIICFPEHQKIQEGLEDLGLKHKESKVYTIGMIVSMPFLLFTFSSHVYIKRLRNLPGLFVMCHTASLFIFCLFSVIYEWADVFTNFKNCRIYAFTTQFWFLAAFFWLNIMCADMWWSFRKLRKFVIGISKDELRKFYIYCCYGWGGPGLILIISLATNLDPDYVEIDFRPIMNGLIGHYGCVTDLKYNKLSAFYYFYGPMGLLIVLNHFFFFSTVYNISHHKKRNGMLNGPESRCNNEQGTRFSVYFKLFILMGISWLTEILGWAFEEPKKLWFILHLSNSLQGLYIFVVFLPKIFDALKEKFRKNWKQQKGNRKKPCKTTLINGKSNDDISMTQIKPKTEEEQCRCHSN